MTDINLLRFRKTDNSLQKKRLKILVILSFGLIIIFSVLHVYLNNANLALHQEWQNLTDHSKQNISETGEDVLFDEMNRAEITQKQLSHALDILRCMAENQIQLTQMQYEDKKITITGWLESPVMLSKSLAFCSDRLNHFSVANLHFSQVSRHFSFDIV